MASTKLCVMTEKENIGEAEAEEKSAAKKCEEKINRRKWAIL
jgi:hypothetical protein